MSKDIYLKKIHLKHFLKNILMVNFIKNILINSFNKCFKNNYSCIKINLFIIYLKNLFKRLYSVIYIINSFYWICF